MNKSGYVLASGLLLALVACAKEGMVSSGSLGGSPGSGGVADAALGTGGATSLGGGVGTGGLATLGTGGGPGIGGSVGAGGVAAGGGALSAGGTRGSGGVVGTGGSLGSGGLTAIGTGGRTTIGGSTGTSAGGAISAGGALASGGALAAGGRSGAGGAGGAVTSDAGQNKTCGTIAGLVCASGQFCDWPVGTCGKTPDGAGTCVATGGTICPAIYAPVCGCDGVTYGTDCERQSKGIAKQADGACPTSSTPCPTDLSQITSWPCTEGLTCEYGTDPRPGCRPSATCSGGTWTVTQAKCTQLPPVTCPATRDAAAGQVCPTDGAYCTYGDLTCACTNCSTGPVSSCGGDLTWHCAAPNADATCPAGLPLLGSTCTSANKTCTYTCGSGGARLCKNGAWYAADGGPCPVSSRRAKKNVQYLDAAERDRIARDLAKLKLATYEYKDPALAGKRHLGFIIEDVPGSPAVDRDGSMVDLYGYASMLVAAVQAQNEEIARLKAELARLKARARIK